MAGHVPAIYVAPLARILQISTVCTAWISGTSPGMTIQGCVGSKIYNHFRFPGQPCRLRGGVRGGEVRIQSGCTPAAAEPTVNRGAAPPLPLPAAQRGEVAGRSPERARVEPGKACFPPTSTGGQAPVYFR